MKTCLSCKFNQHQRCTKVGVYCGITLTSAETVHTCPDWTKKQKTYEQPIPLSQTDRDVLRRVKTKLFTEVFDFCQ